MDIAKVEASLEHLRYLLQQPDEFLFTVKYLREHFSEALVELEKPDDDYLDLEGVVQCICEDAGIECESSDFDGKPDYYVQLDESHAKELIQEYAESYHAKKCAECQKAKESL